MIEDFALLVIFYYFVLVFTSAVVSCADNGGCADSCAVIDGVEQCFCPSGFVLNRFDQQTCLGKLLILVEGLNGQEQTLNIFTKFCLTSAVKIQYHTLLTFKFVVFLSLYRQ